MVVRISVTVLRLSALLALILGILFWTSNAGSWTFVHMGLGLLVTLSLWVLGASQAFTERGNWGLAAGAFVLGAILPIFGMMQEALLPGAMHWIIQVIHLLLGLSALGLGEEIARRYKLLSGLATA